GCGHAGGAAPAAARGTELHRPACRAEGAVEPGGGGGPDGWHLGDRDDLRPGGRRPNGARGSLGALRCWVGPRWPAVCRPAPGRFRPQTGPTPGTLRRLLRALAVPAGRIPNTLEEQAGLYRSLLAGKRVLVVLDDARNEDQVRPLLPGSSLSMVIVTSRSQLTGLAAGEGAHVLSL